MNKPAKFILNKKALIKQYKIVKQMCDEVSYSAKTNYEAAEVLEKNSNCFFSIHSGESINKVNNKKRIWFIAQAWDEAELKSLFELKIENFIVDNESDLNILIAFMEKNNNNQHNKKIKNNNEIKNSKKKINLLLRMRLKEHTIHTGKYFVFGMYSSQINRLIPVLRKNKNINKLGVHFHRKTQNVSEWSLKYELSELLTEETLKSIDCLNIGGGIPIRYKNFRVDVYEQIFTEIKKLRSWLNENKIKLIIEPGRFLAGPAIKLVATIKNIYDNNIIINCSVYNSALDTIVANIKLEIDGEIDEGSENARDMEDAKAYTIKGQTPCSMDIFRYKVFLKNPKVGGKIVFINAGAYNFYSDFCNLKKIKTDFVD